MQVLVAQSPPLPQLQPIATASVIPQYLLLLVLVVIVVAVVVHFLFPDACLRIVNIKFSLLK